jgi:preprotein translocase subunit SecA
MGKKEKEHRKKVEARNQKINAQKNAMQKIFDESMKKQLEDLKKQYDAAKTGGQQPTA